MKLLKLALVALFAVVLVTGCGTEESKGMSLSCSLETDFLDENRQINLEFEEDKIVKADLSIGYDTGSTADQSYVDAVCESYEMNEGLDCEGIITDESYTTYEIKVDNHDSTISYLSNIQNVEGETYDDIKASLEDQQYTCK